MSLIRSTDAYKEIKKDIKSGQLSHAYVVFSADTEAIDQLFLTVAEEISCKNGGCGECETCSLILEKAHPDVKFIDGGQLNAEKTRQLIDDTYLKGAKQERKLYFIENGENLDPRGQNILLKTFEEPPENVVIFISASNDASLLQTIKSRAKKLYISPFKRSDLIDELIEEGVPEEDAETVAMSSAGSYTRAKNLLSNQKFLELYERVFDMMTKIKKSPDVAEYLQDSMWNKDNINMTLDFVELILSDVLNYVSGNVDDIYMDDRRDLSVIADGFSPVSTAMAVKRVNAAREKVNLNLSLTTVAETLLFEILEAKYKWQR